MKMAIVLHETLEAECVALITKIRDAISKATEHYFKQFPDKTEYEFEDEKYVCYWDELINEKILAITPNETIKIIDTAGEIIYKEIRAYDTDDLLIIYELVQNELYTPAETGKEWNVFNATDGVYVTHELVDKEQAEEIIHDFPKRFEHQGYYLTARHQRIPAEDVVLQIVNCTQIPPFI